MNRTATRFAALSLCAALSAVGVAACSSRTGAGVAEGAYTLDEAGASRPDAGSNDASSAVRPDGALADGATRPSDAGGAACYDEEDAQTSTGMASPQAGQGLCSGASLDAFFAACLGPSSSLTACDAHLAAAANQACVRCILGPRPGDAAGTVPQPVLLAPGATVTINVGACEQLAVGASSSCAAKAGDEAWCLASACDTCELAGELDACSDVASKGACSSAALGPACKAQVASSRAVADAKCGSGGGATFESIYRQVGMFMCGAP
ncbi:MAG: hypothetical protein HOO96_32120 [Polyangiaceae bacterium]|nr:hypothetical protein [Polyangiaceae bacterium]